MSGRGKWREVVWWTLPALVAGLALRCALTARMPWGYVQYDSSEYLATAYRLLKGGAFYVDGKRGFLVPVLFAAPFLLRLPALIWIPLGQHLLGLGAVLMSGGLVRLWFERWRWFIVPVTMWVALNPMLLWYEQTIMGEAEFQCALIALALAGTLWARRQTPGRLGLLVTALVCTAGARPEGRLFFGFGLLLAAVVLWGQWKRMARCAGAMVVAAVVCALVVRQSTAPQLLYASLIQLAPDHSRLEPGIEPYILPLRDEVRAESGGDPQGLVKVSKKIRDALDPWLRLKAWTSHAYYKALNRTLRNLCLDAVMAHPLEAAGIPLQKFRAAVDGWSAYQFNEQALRVNQENAYESDPWMAEVLGPGLTGGPVRSVVGMKGFVEGRYDAGRVAWLGWMQGVWNGAMIRLRTPDAPAQRPRWVHDFAGGVPGGLRTMPGVPLVYVAALLGMVAAVARRGEAGRVHLAWAPVMVAVWYAATFVGVTNARYRFAYEPFCVVYALLLADAVVAWARGSAQAQAD